MKIENIEVEENTISNNKSIIIGSDLIYENNLEKGYSINPFDQNNDLLQEEITNRIVRQKKENEFNFKFTKEIINTGELENPAFPLSIIHPGNYFHFLIESLPNLVELLNEKKINEKSIIVTTHIHESCLDALKIVLGINYVPIIQLNLFNKINLKKIIISKSSAHAVEKIDGKTPVYKFKKRNIKLLRNTFKKYWDPYLEIKIFIVRDSKYRNLTNQNELIEIARKNGYHVINPEKLTLLEQIKIFSNARNIVGQTGAWLSNLIFVKNDSKVTILLPKIEADSPPSMWRMLAKLWDFEVTDIYCPITNINNYQPIHSDFKLDPELFINILKK